MTIQEEIKIGVQEQILLNNRKPSIEMAEQILKYLDSKGVVVKSSVSVGKDDVVSVQMYCVERLIEE